MGLTLYNGESNYREIAYQVNPGSSTMRVRYLRRGYKPHAGSLLFSTNSGVSWSPVARDMIFVTYPRK
ncbi:hypothetical protein D187_002815 [Cystobacter fuscus DSM 2262]|uniref:Uncharacterized protein n=1 Tax=Cystobacter fuscus (strain ATCC 25194 / DSM 2262 / NBRC 100088 / M29) TaxID=1242864 RepID=S9P4C3_CYSF2|nr:hypothetical protein D187_002815 [Cystobacter fuscus DSM 2262]